MKIILSALVALGMIGCTSADQLTKILEKDPSPILAAMKKHPKKFAEAFGQLQQDAQKKSQEDFIKDLEIKMNEQFKTPLEPTVDNNRTLFGPSSAAITIVEYSDFLCYYCGKATDTIKKIKEEYGDKVRFVYKHLPFKGEIAKTASLYFEAIADQDKNKAYKFHDAVFENQKEVGSGGSKLLDKLAKKVGANLSKVKKMVKSEEIQKRIASDLEEGRKFEIGGTPGFVVNGVMLAGAFPYEMFKKVIDHHLNGKKGEFKLQDEEEAKN